MAVGVMRSETAATGIALPEDLRKRYAAELRRDNQADNREIIVALNTLEVRVKELEGRVNGISDGCDNSASIKSGAPRDCLIVGHAMHRHPNAGERWVEYEGYGDQIMSEGEFPEYDEGDCYDIFFSEQTQRIFSSMLDCLDKIERKMQILEGS